MEDGVWELFVGSWGGKFGLGGLLVAGEQVWVWARLEVGVIVEDCKELDTARQRGRFYETLWNGIA